MDELQLKGSWNKIKGKAKEIYGEITDDTLIKYEGKYDQLVGYLQEKTGKAKDEITKQLGSYPEDESEARQEKEEETQRESDR